MEKISVLGEVAVRAADGTIDIEATLTALEDQLLKLSDSEATLGEGIAKTVHAIFDANVGKTLQAPYVCAQAAALMEVGPSEHGAAVKAVGLWVRNSPEFKTAKGKGGGVRRVCDIPPEAEKA